MTRWSYGLSCALLGCAAAGIGCSSVIASEEPAVEMVSVQAIPLVRIRVVVRNSTSERVLVPYCGDLEGTDVLCGLATQVEVHDKGRWRQAKPSGGGVLGGHPLERGRTIEAGGERPFVFQFSRDEFEIGAGMKVRLVIDAWHVGETIRAKSPGMQLETGSFDLPVGRS